MATVPTSVPTGTVTEMITEAMVEISAGDTAWMLASTALVLFMTMPGLALFYAGMVQTKNVLGTVMQIFSITCIVTVSWLFWGYSLSFGPAQPDGKTHPVYGDGSRLWMRGLQLNSVHHLAPTIPEAIYCAYHLTFAIITPALMCGSIAERMRFDSLLLFVFIWHVAVYCPIAHSNWHYDGWLFQRGVLDYAGGNVVHIASGCAGLVASCIVGNRKGFKPGDPDTHPPHNILMTYMGMSMLWVGWFGFNAGSACGANPRAAYALLATQIATATSCLAWLGVEWCFRKKPSVFGMINGAVAGMVCITPGAGFVDMNGAFFTGLFGGVLCYFGAQLKHHVLHIDDSLDAFGIHAIGGMIGGIAVGFFATKEVSGVETIQGVYYSNMEIGGNQLANQIVGILFSAGWSIVVSFLILKGIDLTIGLRVSAEDEDAGLDSSIHDETFVNPGGVEMKAVPTKEPA